MTKCYSDLLKPYEGGQYKMYLEKIYNIYKEDLLNNGELQLKGKPVKLRHHPMYKEREESFYHLTHRKYDKNTFRQPDFKRCERIRWIRKMIENVGRCECCGVNIESCAGILIWIEKYKGSDRIHFYLENENFLLVIEKRTEYYLIISSFYVDYNKKSYYIKKYEDNKAEYSDI